MIFINLTNKLNIGIKNLFLFLIILFMAPSCSNTDNVKDGISKIKNKTQSMIDSIEFNQKNKSKLYQYIDSIIYNSPFDLAKQKIDSIIEVYPENNQFRLLKGDFYLHHNDPLNAIEQYNITIKNGFIPVALGNRAAAYISLKDYNNAIIDLKLAATYNIDYNYSIGYTFELMKEFDSAIFYYDKYFNFYNDITVKNHIDSLKNKGNKNIDR